MAYSRMKMVYTLQSSAHFTLTSRPVQCGSQIWPNFRVVPIMFVGPILFINLVASVQPVVSWLSS